METDQLYDKARKKVKNKAGFFVHLAVFIPVGIFLFLLNMFTSPDILWFHFPMLCWGLGLAIHYTVIFGIPGTKILSPDWEEDELDKEIERLRRIQDKTRTKKYLLDMGGFKEDSLDLRELDKQREEMFDEEDLV